MKWDTPTVLLVLLVLGVGAFAIFKGPTQTEKNAELLKQVAKLVAALALLKKKLGLSDKALIDLQEEMKRLHPSTSTPITFASAAASVNEVAAADEGGSAEGYAAWVKEYGFSKPYPYGAYGWMF
jgi:hypothetical protein